VQVLRKWHLVKAVFPQHLKIIRSIGHPFIRYTQFLSKHSDLASLTSDLRTGYKLLVIQASFKSTVGFLGLLICKIVADMGQTD